MDKIKVATIGLCAAAIVSCGNNTGNGALIGAGGGALVGAIIGKVAGNTAVGAALGAAVGTGARLLLAAARCVCSPSPRGRHTATWLADCGSPPQDYCIRSCCLSR